MVPSLSTHDRSLTSLKIVIISTPIRILDSTTPARRHISYTPTGRLQLGHCNVVHDTIPGHGNIYVHQNHKYHNHRELRCGEYVKRLLLLFLFQTRLLLPAWQHHILGTVLLLIRESPDSPFTILHSISTLPRICRNVRTDSAIWGTGTLL
jgi:hypothetical protein